MTMQNIKKDNTLEKHYICGRCGLLQYSLLDDEHLIPCVDCGWVHGTSKPSDIPSQIKLNIGEY